MEDNSDEVKKHLVKDFMTTEVVSVSEDTPIEQVIKLVIEKKFNAFPVVRGSKLVGIVSKMDLIKMYTLGNLSGAKRVKDIMRRAVVAVAPKDPLEYAANLMVDYRIRSLPVTDEQSNLIGILSIGDVLKAFLDEKRG
ncbi:MAG: CBS domain-containing protein [Archaeoglobus sp.]|nr:CBS domain-containing protein [Archaeoglobus sp.]